MQAQQQQPQFSLQSQPRLAGFADAQEAAAVAAATAAAIGTLPTNTWMARFRRQQQQLQQEPDDGAGGVAAASFGQAQQGNGVAAAPASVNGNGHGASAATAAPSEEKKQQDAAEEEEAALERALVDAHAGRMLTPAQIGELVKRHIKTPEDVLCVRSSRWPDTSAFPRALLEALQARVLSSCCAAKPLTALDLFNLHTTQQPPLDTQHDRLNHMLGGGLSGGQITEIVGTSGKGKTQFCLHIAFHVAALGDDVYVLDTCNTFLAKRGSGMLLKPTPPRPNGNNNEGAGASVASGGVGVVSAETKLLCEEALTRVHVAQVFDVFELLAQLDQIYQLCSNISSLASSSGGGGSGGSGGTSGRRLPRLLVIDSLGALLSPIMSSDKRSQVLISTVQRAIKALAATFNIAVLTTNYMVSAGDDTSHDKFVPAMGVSWNYFADTRLQLGADLTQLDSKRTKVTLVKSTRKAIGEYFFCSIGKYGIE